MKVPWKKVSNWICLACGKCCLEYTPKLTFYEYLTMPRRYTIEKSGRYYIRKIGKRCPFQIGNLCGIQPRKPLSCKLFPFTIRSRGNDDAYFEYDNEEFYVYVDTFCPNVKLGKPSKDFVKKVEEAIKIVKGERKDFRLLTYHKDAIRGVM